MMNANSKPCSLLPCPFCGGKATLKRGHGGCEFVACKSCGTRSGKAWRGECLSPGDWSKILSQRTQKAVDLWNVRKELGERHKMNSTTKEQLCATVSSRPSGFGWVTRDDPRWDHWGAWSERILVMTTDGPMVVYVPEIGFPEYEHMDELADPDEWTAWSEIPRISTKTVD
jgi:hypothetical protein